MRITPSGTGSLAMAAVMSRICVSCAASAATSAALSGCSWLIHSPGRIPALHQQLTTVDWQISAQAACTQMMAWNSEDYSMLDTPKATPYK